MFNSKKQLFAVINIIIYIYSTESYILLANSRGDYTYGPPFHIQKWNDNTHYSVGKFCSLSDNITLFLGGNHNTKSISTYPFHIIKDLEKLDTHPLSKGDITIQNDVWIGSHATILSGVTIGNGAVIAAYSVVTKNVPAYAIAAGNPAKIVRYRFTEDQISALLKIAWWDWPLEKIKGNAYLLASSKSEDINLFIKKHNL
jgi:virginiamycin A acetyltransferase